MAKHNKQQGFQAVELVLVAVLVVVLGFIGYRIWQARQQTTARTNTTSANTPTSINTTSDLDKATQTVNQLDASSDLQDLGNMQNDLNSL